MPGGATENTLLLFTLPAKHRGPTPFSFYHPPCPHQANQTNNPYLFFALKARIAMRAYDLLSFIFYPTHESSRAYSFLNRPPSTFYHPPCPRSIAGLRRFPFTVYPARIAMRAYDHLPFTFYLLPSTLLTTYNSKLIT